MRKIQIFIIFNFILVSYCFANSISQIYPAKVSVCFAPYQNCTDRIVQHIETAKRSIYVQAYSFTSGKIAHALVNAKKRGIKVLVILDKSNFNCTQFSYGGYLIRNNVPVWNDYTANIAHNKIMIFDKSIVETGSFNYTKSAQYYNAENMVFITSNPIAKQYLNSWYRRMKVSKFIKKDACSFRHYR